MPEKKNLKKAISVAISLDVEEEGLFCGKYPQSFDSQSSSLNNLTSLLKLRPFLERGVKPTLFCDYAVLESHRLKNITRKLGEYGEFEIGAHLHHWHTPPIDNLAENRSFITQPATNLVPPDLMRQKFKNLFKKINNYFEKKITSFRMGRWDLHKWQWQFLQENDVLCDASVRPLHYKTDHGAGPDHFLASQDPYWLTKSDNLSKDIFEVPLTVVPVSQKLPEILSESLKRNFTKWGVLALLPVYHPLWLLKYTTIRHINRGGKTLSFTWHSSEMWPGGTPHLANEKQINKFLHKISKYLDWLESRYTIVYTTMSDLRQQAVNNVLAG